MSKEGSDFFNKFTNRMMTGINTCSIAQIEAFDGVKMKADVKVLPDGDYVLSVPVMALQTNEFYVRVPYKKGDHVFVAFSQRDIDGIMYGGSADASQRMLSMDDAVVLGGINLFTQSLPSEDQDKLVIGQKDGAAKITMGNGVIDLNGTVKINGVSQ